ncbi:hypothetical protein IAR55_001424 [Kwoniella newhampshirensis]|uniref:Calcium uniporter protein, mitochondrial n=1 Tax=Kwoniella newhampshirensis TaxID=1651941 RepID=A0AAW0Z240_9TREE
MMRSRLVSVGRTFGHNAAPTRTLHSLPSPRPSSSASSSKPCDTISAIPRRRLHISLVLSQSGKSPRTHSQSDNKDIPKAESDDPVHIEGATDLSHAHFISSASPRSDFNPSQTPFAGQDPTSIASASAAADTPDLSKWEGKLSPTTSHLFKLILPLPSPPSSSSGGDKTPTPRPTAFLLHPSQPLSHLSRLIAGSLPSSYRGSDISYLALTGQESDIDSHLRNAEEEQQSPHRQEGGPHLTERKDEEGRWQEVSWSQSTDLSDFIKQSCLNERFKIIISPEEKEGLRKQEDISVDVVIPSFASRTAYIRKRLLSLTKELDRMTKQKKSIDYAAHKGAQRLAVAALGGGVAYWAAVIRFTFFTDAGWDMMEPVTWATGFAALLGSAAFLIYHNREVSYSSLLDLSITARQRKLYEQAGLDIEKWTEMVSEAKTLRREISRIAADYDIEWRGELENLAEEAARTIESRRASASHPSSSSRSLPSIMTTNTTSKDSGSHRKRDEEEDEEREEEEEKLDIDKTIDEASELAEQSEEKRSKEKAAQRKGEVIEPDNKKNKDRDRGERKRRGEGDESSSELRGMVRGKKEASSRG